jgi:hypothetical protein
VKSSNSGEKAVIERRMFERTSTSIRVEMSHPSFGTIIGFAKDISDGGAQVQIENQIFPPVGTEVMVKFRKTVGAINQEAIPMRVVHQLRNTLGLMFIKGKNL